ncbi:MAG TPA: dephospho-CoA kinase [Nevskiaceae bacterium]|nr:dephospho-CoA kinase [Nevskiaceae bacterium]
MPRLVVGLTGGIASGKSLAADRFVALGVPVADADQASRDVVRPGTPALTEIAREFGAEFITPAGELDRRRMREHVFSSPAARHALEAIVHPRIFEQLRLWRDAQSAPYCMLSAAILLESGMKTLVQRVLVVDAEPAAQLQRLVGRDGIGEELGRAMISAQAARETRLAAADDVIRNDRDPAWLLQQVDRQHQRYLQLATEG